VAVGHVLGVERHEIGRLLPVLRTAQLDADLVDAKLEPISRNSTSDESF
jgi:hypothetical protein